MDHPKFVSGSVSGKFLSNLTAINKHHLEMRGEETLSVIFEGHAAYLKRPGRKTGCNRRCYVILIAE